MNPRTLIFLAWKDLTKDLRILSLVVLAVGSGSLAIVPLRGLLEGLTSNLIATTIDVSSGHVIIVPREDRPFLRNTDDIRAAAATLPEVEAVSVRLLDRCLVVKGDKSFAAAGVGVDPESEVRATTIREKVTTGRFLEATAASEVVVGKEVADKLQIRSGENVEVVFSNGSRQWLRVAGSFSTGMRQIDAQVYLHLRRLQSVLQAEGRASEIILRLTDIELAHPYRLRLQRMGLEGRVDTWRDRLEFVESMRKNYAFIQNFLVLLTFVAAGIATAVLIYTNIQHKRRSIGILKAIGAKDRGILGLFLAQGLVIGVVGAVVGDLLGGGICYYMSRHPVAMGLSMASVPLRATFSADLFVLPTILILITTAVSAFYPAWSASRMEIVEAIWDT